MEKKYRAKATVCFPLSEVCDVVGCSAAASVNFDFSVSSLGLEGVVNAVRTCGSSGRCWLSSWFDVDGDGSDVCGFSSEMMGKI